MLVYHRNDKSAPKGLRYCGRGGKWSNPFRLPRGADGAARRRVIADYIVYVDEKLATGALDIAALRGALRGCPAGARRRECRFRRRRSLTGATRSTWLISLNGRTKMGTDGLTDTGMALAWVNFTDVPPPD